MAETHINAFFGDVEAKQQAVVVAQGELEAAKVRLEAKKKEVGYAETQDSEVEDAPVREEVKSSNSFKRR